jgi:hypothetical protein
MEAQTPTLSSRPERTRISYIATLSKATIAAFRRESRMKSANATKLNRKSGYAPVGMTSGGWWPTMAFVEVDGQNQRNSNQPNFDCPRALQPIQHVTPSRRVFFR